MERKSRRDKALQVTLEKIFSILQNRDTFELAKSYAKETGTKIKDDVRPKWLTDK